MRSRSPSILSHLVICRERWKMSDEKPGLMMLGFDGATWTIINSLLEEGYLPNIRRVMESGVYAKLKSPEPLSTPIIWTTIYTGGDMASHGVRNFFNTISDIKMPRIWDILLHNGTSAGICGNYFSYPINEKLSFCIPSHFDAGVETYPKRYTYIREITKAVGSKKVNVGGVVRSGLSALRSGLRPHSIFYALRSVLSVAFNRKYLNVYYRFKRLSMDLWFDAFFHAYKRTRPDFVAYYSPLPDTISHQYWSYHEPGKFSGINPKDVKKYGNVIRDTYRHCDRHIGRVLKALPPDTQICILSDHGFKILEKAGDMIVLVAEKLIDFFGLKGQLVVTNLGHRVIFQPKTDELTEKLVKILQDAHICETKTPAFHQFVIDRDTNTIRFMVNMGKIKKTDTKIVLNGKEIKMDEIARVASPWTGMHDAEDGVVIVAGPGVRKDGEKEMMRAVDIAPTLLRLQGIDIAEHCDGRIREDFIDEDWASRNPAKVIECYDSIPFRPEQETRADEEEIAERLKSLGYM